MSSNLTSFKGVFPTLGLRNYIDINTVICGDVEFGDDCSVWPFVAIRGDVNYIRIGHRSNIQDGSVLHVTRRSENNPTGNPLIIGNDVTIGHKVMLHGCTIGSRILVGMGAIIMDGAVVNDNVFIGAGTLVPPNKVLESGYLYVGNPMKKSRPLNDNERAFLTQSAINYVTLKDDYLA